VTLLTQPAPFWTAFLFICCRLGTALAIAPVFGQRGTPPQIKVMTTLVLALAYLPLVDAGHPAADTSTFLLLVAREILIGAEVGLAVLLTYNALLAAGQIVGTQMGFTMGSIVSPMHSDPLGAIDHFYALLATAVFLAMDGHHHVLLAVHRTYDLAPMGTFGGVPAVPSGPALFAWGGELFLVGARMALPVAGALFLADVALALVSRALPQLNVFIDGAPVKIAAGLLMLMVTVPVTMLIMANTLGQIGAAAARLLGGG
jgi:flagellar biosynthetic protein FliR